MARGSKPDSRRLSLIGPLISIVGQIQLLTTLEMECFLSHYVELKAFCVFKPLEHIRHNLFIG
jgi:hypothetical protein